MLTPALRTVWNRICQTLTIDNTLAAPHPVITPAVTVPPNARWQVNWNHPAAYTALRTIIDQDMLRWLDRQPTLLSETLLLFVDKHLPPAAPNAGPVLTVSHEEWVRFSHALVTLEITQVNRPDAAVLPGLMPCTLIDLLLQLRFSDRTPAHA